MTVALLSARSRWRSLPTPPRPAASPSKKTVVGGDSQREFGFTVALADGDGEPSPAPSAGRARRDVHGRQGDLHAQGRRGEDRRRPARGRALHRDRGRRRGATRPVNGADGSKAEGAVTETARPSRSPTRTERPPRGRDVSTAGLFTKTLEGRDWAEGDSFQFTLTGEAAPPCPRLCRRLQDRQRDGRRRHQGGR